MSYKNKLPNFSNIKSFQDFEEKLCSCKVSVDDIVEKYFGKVINAVSSLPENEAQECYIYLASKYCDGTEKKYNKWVKMINDHIKNPKVPKKQKEILAFLD